MAHFWRMGPVVLLFALSLLHSCEVEGTSTPLFVQTGNNLFLDVQHVALGEADFIWKINGSKNIVKLHNGDKTRTHKSYVGRAEFSIQNYSLTLKNVQKNDSGGYAALVSGDQDQLVAEYKVTVQDPVSPVELTVNSSSSDTCNLTVTCSTVDTHISSTFRCDKQICSLEGEERSEATTYPSSINVYLEEGIIICNHSNNVSSKQDMKEMKYFCGSPPVSSGAITIGIGTGVGIAVLAAVSGLFLFIKYKKKDSGNTIYDVPQDINSAQTLNQNPTEDASGLSPTSTYCLVNFHTGPAESTKTKNTLLPETVYAQVNRSAKTNSRSPRDQHPELENPDTIYLHN